MRGYTRSRNGQIHLARVKQKEAGTPVIQCDIREGWTGEQKQALADESSVW